MTIDVSNAGRLKCSHVFAKRFDGSLDQIPAKKIAVVVHIPSTFILILDVSEELSEHYVKRHILFLSEQCFIETGVQSPKQLIDFSIRLRAAVSFEEFGGESSSQTPKKFQKLYDLSQPLFS